MRDRRVALVLLVAVLVSSISIGASARPPAQQTTVGGQVKVVTVNAKQGRVLGIKRFLAMFELGRGLRYRPEAFNGGFSGAVHAPDVILIQEMRPSNLEIFERLLRQRFPYRYRIVGPVDAAATIIANLDTVTQVGDVVRWADVCTDPNNPPDGRAVRDYQFARFTENTTGLPFVVTAMHLAKNYSGTGQSDCLIRNIDEMRRQLTNETAPVIIGGDFNRRPVDVMHECDENEESAPLSWWSAVTTPTDGGRAYPDAVLTTHRAEGESMADEWTHEQKTTTLACDGSTRFRRNRIDYLFSSGALVAEAHADHPGWAGVEPGTRHPTNPKYSDHRWVWGRFLIGGPPPATRPSTEPGRDGLITVTWQPVEGATEYVVYRAVGPRAYDALARVDGATLSFRDTFTGHDKSYRYAIAAVGPEGAHGLESGGSWERADKRGPEVTSVVPHRNATGVDIRTTLEVRFDERVDPDSVTQDSIDLRLNGRSIAGRVEWRHGRLITFNPRFPLRKGKDYHGIVKGLQDKLGNRSEWFGWVFATEEPPPKKKRRRR